MATGLFLERGFEAVTIAEIAEAAEVSVNTVYNYFPAKEDLFLDRRGEEEVRLARVIEGREPGSPPPARSCGTSAPGWRAAATSGSTRASSASWRSSTTPGADRPGRGDARPDPPDRGRDADRGGGRRQDDPLPMLIADQLAWVESAIFQAAVRLVADGGDRDAVVAELTRRLDVIESLLGERTLNYAVKNTP
ncbi:helix-turn-helix domain-containing protein [Streptomyces sp. M19]